MSLEWCDYLINQDYHINTSMSNLKYEPVKHSNPEFFGLTNKWAYKKRLRHLRKELRRLEERVDHWNSLIIKSNIKVRWFLEIYYFKYLDEFEKIQKHIYYINRLLKGSPEKKFYNIEEIKRIPINTIVEVNSAGFFKIRDENTPSVKWYKDQNEWHDFGTDEHGDIIDLIMKLNNCSFIRACKILGCG